MASNVTIYHNPACGTSRNTLAMIRATGTEPVIIEYLKTPPSRADLLDLVRRMDVPLRTMLRQKGTPYAEPRAGRSGAVRRRTAGCNRRASHPHQPADRRHAEGLSVSAGPQRWRWSCWTLRCRPIFSRRTAIASPRSRSDAGRAIERRESANYDRVVDVMEELLRFTCLLRDRGDYLVDRYSERKTTFELPAL